MRLEIVVGAVVVVSGSGRALVLYGGTGPERAGSLVSGDTARQSLERLGWRVTAIDVNPESMRDASDDVDVALVATHGWFGEDGKLQGWLETHGIAYTGSGVLASASAMHKPSANRMFLHAGLAVPAWFAFSPILMDEAMIEAWAKERGYPLFCKPTSGGGSLGATRLDSEEQLRSLLDQLAQGGGEPEQMLSPFIDGAELSVAVRSSQSGHQCLPILETRYDAAFYDYDVKHQSDLRRHHCPAQLDASARHRVEAAAINACESLGCYGYSRVDFRLDASGTPWLLEVNTVPGLSREGNLATMAFAHGFDYDDLIGDFMQLAMNKPATYRP